MRLRDRLLDRLFRRPIAYRVASALLLPYRERDELWSRTLRRLLSKHCGVEIGMYTYGAVLKRGLLPPGSKVGRWCSISRNLRVRRRNHPTERVSQHPFFYLGRLGVVESATIPREADNPLTIGHDVWIGDNVVILPGCRTIGNGAVVAAGAIVASDVAPYAIVGGVPAKRLRDRFPPEVQRHLEESRWWEFNLTTLATLRPMLLRPLDGALAAEFAESCRVLRERIRASSDRPRR
jgi:virginiamycin A acetyltransferase